MEIPGMPQDVVELRERVDDVLLPWGFTTGQLGLGGTRCQVIWCAPGRTLAARAPHLPSSREPAGGWNTECADLVLDLALIGGRWIVESANLEGYYLPDLRVGPEPMERPAQALCGRPVRECLTTLPALLTTVLTGFTDHLAEPTT